MTGIFVHLVRANQVEVNTVIIWAEQDSSWGAGVEILLMCQRGFHGHHTSRNEMLSDKSNYSETILSLHLKNNKIIILKYGCNQREKITNKTQWNYTFQSCFAIYIYFLSISASFHLYFFHSPLLSWNTHLLKCLSYFCFFLFCCPRNKGRGQRSFVNTKLTTLLLEPFLLFFL